MQIYLKQVVLNPLLT